MAVQDTINELGQELSKFEPAIEGFSDFTRLVEEPALSEIRTIIDTHKRQMGLILDAQRALQALLDGGYPFSLQHEISPTALQDVRANAATIEAALALFSSNVATGLRFTSGSPQPR